MINISKKELKEIKKLSEILKDHGIFTINNYLLKNEVSKLKEEVLHHHKIIGNSYPFGSTYSIKNPKELPNKSFQKRTFSNSWMKSYFLTIIIIFKRFSIVYIQLMTINLMVT